DADVDQARRADRRRVRLNEIFLVEQVLHPEERLEVAADIARDRQIDGGVAGQTRSHGVVAGGRQRRRGNKLHVQIVVELQAGRLNSERDRGDLRVGVRELQ